MVTKASSRPPLKDITMAVLVDSGMYERIRIAAFKEDVSKSEIIRRALHSFLSQHEKEAA